MTLLRRPSSGLAAGDAIPFRHGGRTHLFFLSPPPGTTDYPDRLRTTWHHAVTDDLATWGELPPAAKPGMPGDVDADGAWTGSVVERDGVFHLFYTGHRIGAANPQTICRATSDDLVRFTKDPRNPLLLPPPGCEMVDWRDPYVFYNEDEQRHWMIIAARLAAGPRWRRGALMLATSSDLDSWEVEPEPLYIPRSTYCPECPELWPLDGRWYLVYSRFSEMAGTIYRVADGPRGPFRVPADDELGGRRWYAAKSAPGPDGRSRTFFGWIHDRGPDDRWHWGGDLAAPREVVADTDGALVVRLPDAVRALYAAPVPLDGAASAVVSLHAAGSFAHHAFAPPALPATYLARGRFSWDRLPASFGFTIATDADLGGWFVTVDRVRGTVSLARSPEPLDDFVLALGGRGAEYREVDGPRVAEARVPWIGARNRLECLVLADGSLLEVYVDDRVALTHRIDRGGGVDLGAFVVDGSVTCEITMTTPA